MRQELGRGGATVESMVRDFLARAEILDCKASEFAEFVNIPQSTLKQRLSYSGTNWRRLLFEERQSRLVAAMEEPGLPDAGELTETLGFADVGTFYRFFAQAIGRTFTDWRMERQGF